jgi:hypothetical protein
MNVQEIVAVIPKLGFEERLELSETLSQSLRGVQSHGVQRSVPASKLRGVLKINQTSPTNDDIKQDYLSYLEEKYS